MYNIEDFENVDRYEVVANCDKGYWLEPDGEFVLYSDYKDLLDTYKELLWMSEELEK